MPAGLHLEHGTVIIGDSVAATYGNLDKIMREVAKVLEPAGKFVLLESTVPAWFLAPYKIAFPLLLKLWPLKHPPTFQFYFREIVAAAEKAGTYKLEAVPGMPVAATRAGA